MKVQLSVSASASLPAEVGQQTDWSALSLLHISLQRGAHWNSHSEHAEWENRHIPGYGIYFQVLVARILN